MKGQHLQSVFSLMITLLCLGSLMTIFIWNKFDDSNMEPHRPPHQKKSAPKSSDLCTGCKEIIDKVAKCYSQTWKKQEENYHRLRLQLSIHCNGSNNAILTQENTPVGSKIFYDGDKKRTFQVTPKVFKTFAKHSLKSVEEKPGDRTSSKQSWTGLKKEINCQSPIK